MNSMNDQNPPTKNNRARVYAQAIWSLLKLLKYSKYLRKVPYFFKQCRNATTDPLQAIIGFLDRPELPVDLSQPLKHRMSKIQSQISDKSLSVKQQQIITSMVAAAFFSVAVRATADAVRFRTVVPERPANPQPAGTLPTPVQFALILLSPKRRDDVLNDLLDWYPVWVTKGSLIANLRCLAKIGSVFLRWTSLRIGRPRTRS